MPVLLMILSNLHQMVQLCINLCQSIHKWWHTSLFMNICLSKHQMANKLNFISTFIALKVEFTQSLTTSLQPLVQIDFMSKFLQHTTFFSTFQFLRTSTFYVTIFRPSKLLQECRRLTFALDTFRFYTSTLIKKNMG